MTGARRREGADSLRLAVHETLYRIVGQVLAGVLGAGGVEQFLVGRGELYQAALIMTYFMGADLPRG